jgi:hypothetical protein
MTDTDLTQEKTLRQLAEAQTLTLAKLDDATQMIAEILQLVSPPPPEEANSLHDLLARMVEALDQQGVMLGDLSATMKRLERTLTPGADGA